MESLSIRDTSTLIELFKKDLQFKRFLGIKLKEKVLKTTNISLKELMTTLYETLDIEEVRTDLIRYALNQENFYAFPTSYVISLLVKVYNMAPRDDLKDFLKTV